MPSPLKCSNGNSAGRLKSESKQTAGPKIKIMRFVKFVLISGIGLFVVMMAFSFLLPSHLLIGRSVNIAAPREKVMAAVGDLRAWEQWNAFIRTAPLTGK